MTVLFLCSRNQWRSPTAEVLFRDRPDLQVQSAGLSSSARRRVTEKLLRWADLILVMEHEHKRRLREDFPDLARELRVHVLDIPDDYEYMAPELIELLLARVPPFLCPQE